MTCSVAFTWRLIAGLGGSTRRHITGFGVTRTAGGHVDTNSEQDDQSRLQAHLQQDLHEVTPAERALGSGWDNSKEHIAWVVAESPEAWD